MDIQNIENWHGENPQYNIYFNDIVIGEYEYKYYEFQVITKKIYQQGRCFHLFLLTDEYVEEVLEQDIIETLSDFMDDQIDLLIGFGEIKEANNDTV